MTKDFTHMSTSYVSDIDQYTLYEDVQYATQLHSHATTAFVRPSDRCSTSNALCWQKMPDNSCLIGLIDVYGSHETQTPAQLRYRIGVRQVSCEIYRVRDIPEHVRMQMYAEIVTHTDVVSWLSVKYPHEKITLDSVVTVYIIEYID